MRMQYKAVVSNRLCDKQLAARIRLRAIGPGL